MRYHTLLAVASVMATTVAAPQANAQRVSLDALVADPIAALQGKWYGSSGEATKPNPYEMEVRGNRVFVTVREDSAGIKSVHRPGEMQAELGTVDTVRKGEYGVSTIRLPSKCWAATTLEYSKCSITLTHEGTNANAPKDSVTIYFHGYSLTLYRADHLAQLKKSYSASYFQWK